jgi:hypothetical protein
LGLRWQAEPFNKDDLIELWNEGGGRCMLTGLPFRETPVGSGQARRPFPHRLKARSSIAARWGSPK